MELVRFSAPADCRTEALVAGAVEAAALAGVGAAEVIGLAERVVAVGDLGAQVVVLGPAREVVLAGTIVGGELGGRGTRRVLVMGEPGASDVPQLAVVIATTIAARANTLPISLFIWPPCVELALGRNGS